MSGSDISQLCARFSDEALTMARLPSQLEPGTTVPAPGERLINGSLSAAGNPLRGFYVECNGHSYQTDAVGRVSIPSSATAVQAKVWAANDAVRILNGEKFNLAYTQDVTIMQSGNTSVSDENNAFSLALKCHEALEDFRLQFPFWSSLAFSFGTDRRIEVSWPDKSPANLAFTEPTAVTGFPLIHFKASSGFTLPDDWVIWHEFGHALHFAESSHQIRDFFKWHYLGYILSHLSNPFHDYPVTTDETVAWIEAWGDFCGGNSFGRFRPCDPSFVPVGNGSTVEGAIANLLFLGMPSAAWSLDTVAKSYVQSQARTVAEFGTYIAGISPKMFADLRAQGLNWNIRI